MLTVLWWARDEFIRHARTHMARCLPIWQEQSNKLTSTHVPTHRLLSSSAQSHWHTVEYWISPAHLATCQAISSWARHWRLPSRQLPSPHRDRPSATTPRRAAKPHREGSRIQWLYEAKSQCNFALISTLQPASNGCTDFQVHQPTQQATHSRAAQKILTVCR